MPFTHRSAFAYLHPRRCSHGSFICSQQIPPLRLIRSSRTPTPKRRPCSYQSLTSSNRIARPRTHPACIARRTSKVRLAPPQSLQSHSSIPIFPTPIFWSYLGTLVQPLLSTSKPLFAFFIRFFHQAFY